MAQDELVLEGAIQAFQDTHTTDLSDLSDATAHPLADTLAELLEVAGGKIRTGITLDHARVGKPKGHYSLMAFQQGGGGALLTQRGCGGGTDLRVSSGLSGAAATASTDRA